MIELEINSTLPESDSRYKLYDQRNNQPELLLEEWFYTNHTTDKVNDILPKLQQRFSSVRIGEIGYDIHNRPISGVVPIFVKDKE